MGEFWTESDEAEEVRFDCKAAASAAHITTVRSRHRRSSPEGAISACHRSISRPSATMPLLRASTGCISTAMRSRAVDRHRAGMTFGSYGMNFERTQAWWENGGKAWMEYLTRSQALLQAGRFVAARDRPHRRRADLLGHREQIWKPGASGL